jgi:hypothetical protein
MDQGRPSIYTQEIASLICEGLAKGMTLREVCRGEGMPHESTVRSWALSDYEGFYTQYAKAREIGYHAMADETIDIADNAQNDWMERNGEDDAGWQLNGEHIQRSRLRIDTRKWLLSKALPKVYGDKLLHGSDPDNPLPSQTAVTINMTPEQAAEAYASAINPEGE